ncbi:MAG: hypothetical protein V1874_10115 [Spirochaetota bacterium]
MTVKLIFLFIIIAFSFSFNCSEDKETHKAVVSFQIQKEKEISEKDAALYAGEYDKIQNSMENIIKNNFNSPDKAAELLINLTKKSVVLGREISNCSQKSNNRILKHLKKKAIDDDVLKKTMKMYNENKKFAKAYNSFVQSFSRSAE